MDHAQAIKSLKKVRTLISNEAEPIFQKANLYHTKISGLNDAIKALCNHPKDYLEYEQIETSPIEHRVNQTICALCEQVAV